MFFLVFRLIFAFLQNITLMSSLQQASLQPFLADTYNFSSSTTGLVFMVFGLTYTVGTPLFGWISDRGMASLGLLALGNAVIAIGFLLLGPAPFLQPLFGSRLELELLTIGLKSRR